MDLTQLHIKRHNLEKELIAWSSNNQERLKRDKIYFQIREYFQLNVEIEQESTTVLRQTKKVTDSLEERCRLLNQTHQSERTSLSKVDKLKISLRDLKNSTEYYLDFLDRLKN
jgi:hypothetical protein